MLTPTPILPAPTADFFELDDVTGTSGNCEDVIKDYERRIRTVLSRMSCDEISVPHEKVCDESYKGGYGNNKCINSFTTRLN